MSLTSKSLILLLSIAAVGWADKDKDKKFEPAPVSAYPARQTIQNLTVAAQAYDTQEQTRDAFGKLNPNKHGILPVLVVMQNDGQETLTLETMRVEYITGFGDKIEATPAAEVKYASGPSRPDLVPGPVPRIPGASRKRNPLDAWEIEGRAFAARMLPPGASASGFFYFQTPHRTAAKLYLTGIRVAATGSELFYFEISLEKAAK